MTLFRALFLTPIFLFAALGQSSQPSAPALRVVGADGLQDIRSRHKGKILVLNFWATWCKPCVEEFPGFVQLSSKYGAKGVDVVFVSIDEDDAKTQRKVTTFLRKRNAPGPWYIKRSGDDEQFINAVHPRWSGALPATLIYDKNGNLSSMKVEETSFGELEKTVLSLLR